MNEPVEFLGVREAASELGVSVRRVQALASAGRLPSRKIGNRLLFDASSVRQYAEQNHPRGRPFDPSVAWAVLSYASGRDWPEIDASLRWRHKRRSADLLDAVQGQRLFRRASLHAFRAVPADVLRLQQDDRLVFSGVSAAGEYHIDIVAPDIVEAYVNESVLEDIVSRYWMEPSGSAGANVLLRVVPDSVWEVIKDQRYAPAAAAAVDLIDSQDERSRRAGREVLRRLAAHP